MESLEAKYPAHEIKKELDYLNVTLDYLKTYQTLVESKKESVDENVQYGTTHFDPDNAEQFHELMLNLNLQSQLTSNSKNIDRSLLKPYFTRVDFAADDEGKLQELYIGKMSLLRDEDNYPLIIDWRAPVSNLYYEGRLGRAEYISPDGLIEGDISLKRQYIIENGNLDDFFDIDITASDDFLQAALGASKDKRLKDIVSTIQAEQNRVIRADMIRPLIVQGAAGSGKTTIALHRIAYLLYHFENRLSPKSIMILAPNRFFISYISEVLPDLGVESVLQTTWDDFAQAFLDQKIIIKPAVEKLAYMIQNPHHFNTLARVSNVKSSLNFKNAIDNYMEIVVKNILPQKDFALDQYVLMTHDELQKLICTDYHFLPIAKRIPEIRKYLVNALKKAKPEIIKEINGRYDYMLEKIKLENPHDSEKRRKHITEILNKRDELLKRVNNKSKTIVSDYMKKAVVQKPTDYYKKLMKDELIFKSVSKGEIPENYCQSIIQQTSKSIAGNYFEEEDVAALVHIQFRLYGNDWFDIRHIVIDEAQDVSLFQLYVLREIMNSNSFSILGDLRQGIFYYKGINDWRHVTDMLFQKKAEYVEMAQSYRTTVEIMDFANIAAKKMPIKMDVPLAKPVIRHGSDVFVTQFEDLADLAEAINMKAKYYKEEGFASIAIIAKTPEECKMLFNLLEIEGLTLLTGKEEAYGGGIVLIPSYLSKGLEFDGVIIANANNVQYNVERELDIKLLYIAMTRALHALSVFSLGKASLTLD